MRHVLSPEDEAFLSIRSLSVDYSSGGSQAIHSHRWPQLLYARAGAFRVHSRTRAVIIPPRRALLMPAGVRHQFVTSSRLELRTLYLRPELAPEMAEPEALNVSGLLHEAILRVCERQHLDDRRAADRSLSGVIAHELAISERTPHGLPLPSDDRARRAAEAMLAGAGSLDAVFKGSGLTRRTGERLFARETGLPPARWFRIARLTQSVIALAGGAPIDAAAHQAGYHSRSAFSHAFKAVFGFPPGQIR